MAATKMIWARGGEEFDSSGTAERSDNGGGPLKSA